MSGPIQELTLNYQFEIPAFDFPNWHTYYARTLRTIDALFLLGTGITFVRGPWANGKVYALGDVVVDMDVATSPNIYQALVGHTSAATGTFAADRLAHPSFWQARLSLPQFRGTWTGPGTSYFVGDFVVSGVQYAIAKTNHTSGATFVGDAANWTILVDLSAVTAPAINATAEGTIASAATTDIGSVAASRINVTGTTGITSLGTATNTYKILRFSGVVTLTHNATSLILPKATNFVTAAGDILHVVSDGTGNWRVVAGIKADGAPAFIAGVLLAINNLSDLQSFATARGNLGVLAIASNLSDVSNAATARSNLGLAIGTNVQAFDAQLDSKIPQNSKSANYTTVLADGEKQILHALADNNPRTFTIDSNVNVPYPIGTTITFVNRVNVVTIAINGGETLIFAGPGSVGSRTLAANGMATALKTGATEWMISGPGLT